MREELLSYDVIICSDISRGAFTDEQLAWTAELVGKRGGGFVMIGGNASFGSGGWDQTIWDGLIPVDMRGHGAGDSEFAISAFKVQFPEDVVDHPIWRIVEDPQRNREILERMPMFTGTNLISPAEAGCDAPGRFGSPARAGRHHQGQAGGEADPAREAAAEARGRRRPGLRASGHFRLRAVRAGPDVFDVDRLDLGMGNRVRAGVGEGDNRYFRKFWRNVVFWLAENSGSSNRQLRVETDKVFYHPGQPIEITARAYDEKLVETEAYRVAARLRGSSESESQPFDESATNLVPQLGDPAFRGKLLIPPSGEGIESPASTIHQVVLDVAALDGERVVAKSSVPLQVIDDPVEFRDPRPDPGGLKLLAEATGGRVIEDPGELAAVLWGEMPMRRSARSSRDRRSGTATCSGSFCWACSRANGSCAPDEGSGVTKVILATMRQGWFDQGEFCTRRCWRRRNSTMGLHRVAAGFLGTVTGLAAPGPIDAQEVNSAVTSKAPAAKSQDGEEAMRGAVSVLAEQLRRHPAEPSKAADRVAGLYMIEVSTGEVTLIADQPDAGITYCGSAAWSNDGKRIVFDAMRPELVHQAHMKLIEVVAGELKMTDLGVGNCPTFSPRGDRIAFLLNHGGVPVGAGRHLVDAGRRRRAGSAGLVRSAAMVAGRATIHAHRLRHSRPGADDGYKRGGECPA